MASIRVSASGGRRIVTLRGRLIAADLGRLERACGPALEHRELPLELRLTDVSALDDASRAFLTLLARRGAALTWSDNL